MASSVTNSCSACRDGLESPFPFSMAFQPIYDVARQRVFAYEALVRGPQGEPAPSVLDQLDDRNRYAFDQACRVKAITLAASLGLTASGARLSINFMPNAVYSPAACLRLTLKTAAEVGIPADRLIFEVTENEQLAQPSHLRAILAEYKRQGFGVAIDDFGAGHSGLNLLADLPVNILKLDMALIRDLHLRPRSMKIVRAVAAMAEDLGMDIVGEGVETNEELEAVRHCGIHLVQGYLLARPAFEALPEVRGPSSMAHAAMA